MTPPPPPPFAASHNQPTQVDVHSDARFIVNPWHTYCHIMPRVPRRLLHGREYMDSLKLGEYNPPKKKKRRSPLPRSMVLTPAQGTEGWGGGGGGGSEEELLHCISILLSSLPIT